MPDDIAERLAEQPSERPSEGLGPDALSPAVRAALAAARRPVAEARGLPNAFYTDPATFALERRALFHEGWAGLAFAHEATEPGDAVPIDFLGAPLLMLRDRAGALRVYQNVCRHRGMILIDAPRRIEGAIRCPYHSWCYGLDGRLVSTPHVGGPGQNLHADIDRASLGLIEVPSAVWMGVVFVNVSGRAAPFAEAQAELRRRWHEVDRPLYIEPSDSVFQLDLATNWKLAVENYCESYHLPWVHPGLNAYSRLEDHYNIEAPGAFSGQGTRVYRPMLREDGARFPDFEGLSEFWDAGAEYVAIYPNVLLGAHRDHAFAILLEPKGQTETRERVALFYADAESVGPEFAAMRATNTAMWRSVFEEDITVVEGMQRGRYAPGFDGGKFSPVMDSPTHLFHAWAAERLLAAGAA